MLVATNRQTSGEGYRLMADALTRLRGTTVRTNIQTGGVEETRIFGLIEEAKITRKTFDGRMLDLEITLSDWVYRSVIQRRSRSMYDWRSSIAVKAIGLEFPAEQVPGGRGLRA
ncbi:replication initiator protein A [Sphingobium yanoikuyae]|uniref:replication initiator protein A n=1 Tax=Sphingobium yanoikuyae TaxID=13690 RepID=UPI001F3242EF|nr:replication initiator protein A [Sphingobium yanoikuyae]